MIAGPSERMSMIRFGRKGISFGQSQKRVSRERSKPPPGCI